jgi:nitrogen regulatory protein P-II 1
MKILTLIVHTNVQQELADLLRTMDQVPGFTFSHVEGHGTEIENDAYLAARDDAVGYVPRIRTDILLDDSHVDIVLKRLSDNENNIAGQGIYWVTQVEKGGHLL